MPDTVEASSQSSQGIEEGITHPNGEDGVLLSAGLSRSNGFVIMPSNKPTYSKLRDTSQKRAYHNQQARQQSHSCMHDDAGCDGYCNRQSYYPKMEGQVGMSVDETQEGWEGVTDEEAQQQRKDEQREHPLDNHPEGQPETQPACRINEGNKSRDENCGCEVNHHSVSRQRTNVSSQFGSHHSRCSRGWAKETEHRALQKETACFVLYRLMNQTKQGRNDSLKSQQPPLPAFESHVLKSDAAERQRQHQEDERWLHIIDAFHNHFPDSS